MVEIRVDKMHKLVKQEVVKPQLSRKLVLVLEEDFGLGERDEDEEDDGEGDREGD